MTLLDGARPAPAREAPAPGPAAWRPLRIAMVGQKGLPATFGGIEHHVEQVALRLVQRGHRVIVYCRNTYGNRDVDDYLGIELVTAPTVGTKHLDAIVHSGTSTVRAITAGVDVVHYHGLGPGLVAPLPRYLARPKVFLTVHGLDHQRSKWGPAAKAVLGLSHWMSGHVPDEVIVVSRALQEHYEQQFGVKASYVPNGTPQFGAVDPALVARFGLRPGRYAVAVGRLVPEKRADLLIKAFREVPGDFQLAIVGGSSFSNDYEQHLRELASADDRVRLTGYAYGETLSALYQEAAVFVQPSALEGLPLTLLEAVSHGVPVIASDISPHHEVLRQGSPRHRYVAVDDLPQLARVLRSMLEVPPVVDAAARELREAVLAHYSWDAAVDQLEALYLAGGPSRATRAAVTTQPARASHLA